MGHPPEIQTLLFLKSCDALCQEVFVVEISIQLGDLPQFESKHSTRINIENDFHLNHENVLLRSLKNRLHQ